MASDQLHESQFRWPAEWEPQQATWISWPHNHATWPGYFEPIPDVFVHFIQEISRVQRVEVLSGPAAIEPNAKEMLRGMANVNVHDIATNDVWIRDYGPTFVKRVADQCLVGIDWQFNAWGGKYPPYDCDARAAESICDLAGCPRECSWLYCEGGGLETDGQGTVMTTSSVLLSETRNPGRTRSEIEQELARQLGAKRVLWVDGGGLEATIQMVTSINWLDSSHHAW